MNGNGGKPRGQVNVWSGTHRGNQGRAKRLCHTGKRWERQIGTKRQLDLRELLSEVKVRQFCMWSLPAAWGYSQLLLFLQPGSDLNRSWVAAAEQCLCLQSNDEIPMSNEENNEENISCLISIQTGGHCPSTASPSWAGGGLAVLTTLMPTMPKLRHTTKRRSGRTGATS